MGFIKRLWRDVREAPKQLAADSERLQRLHKLEREAGSDDDLVELMQTEMGMTEKDARGMLNIIRLRRRTDADRRS